MLSKKFLCLEKLISGHGRMAPRVRVQALVVAANRAKEFTRLFTWDEFVIPLLQEEHRAGDIGRIDQQPVITRQRAHQPEDGRFDARLGGHQGQAIHGSHGKAPVSDAIHSDLGQLLKCIEGGLPIFDHLLGDSLGIEPTQGLGHGFPFDFDRGAVAVEWTVDRSRGDSMMSYEASSESDEMVVALVPASAVPSLAWNRATNR